MVRSRPARRAALVIASGVMIMTASSCASAPRPTLVDAPSASASASASNANGGADASNAAASDAAAGTEPVGADRADIGVPLERPTRSADSAVASSGAMMTSTGVVVAVEEATADGYLVTTPCGYSTTVEWGQPIGPVEVVLDPGHGGEERGVEADGLDEADLNLDVARRTAAALNRRGVSVMLTRTDDYRMPVSQRTALADQVGARALVSIHHNSPTADPSPTPGTEVYVQHRSEDSQRLGGLVHDAVVASLSRFDVAWSAHDDAGVLAVLNDDGTDAYGINRRAESTSVLVELAYLSNPTEADLLATDEYRTAVSEALADGIEAYLTTTDRGTELASRSRVFNPSGDTGGETGCQDPAIG